MDYVSLIPSKGSLSNDAKTTERKLVMWDEKCKESKHHWVKQKNAGDDEYKSNMDPPKVKVRNGRFHFIKVLMKFL